ncbi:caspase family protein [Aminobacter sp. NyZ550]|uniref:caspase family protein n=1 Tax=Aminobacter sp. NyZ550 TaxID=2979870 RepID=UPI0021D5A8B9|nr:caspase family protein [Aminobacter sp. NyZ550]WAX93490.1 caspase family protein [Aminobacter sp. NyZ550]
MPARNAGILARLSGALAACGLILLLALSTALAADGVSGRRAALVIGNTAYQHLAPLPNPANDADRIREVLERANFEVTLGKDLDKKGLEETILGFLRTLNDGDVALFYYSGHAVQVGGHNFMIPVDATLATSYDLEVQAYNMSSLLEYMRETSSLQIAILDACRDNPFANNSYYVGQAKVAVEGKKGLASVAPQDGTLIVYSTAPDRVALDGNDGLSPFTGTFAEYALKPNVEVRKLLSDIRAEVIKRTDGRQTPWDASSLTSSFFFVTRQNLLIIEDMREVRVPPETKEVALRISPPITSGNAELTVNFTKLPDQGTLWLGDQQLSLDSKIAADRIEEVMFKPASVDMTADEVRYTVTTDGGRSASGIVRVVVDSKAVAEAQVKPALNIQQGDEPKPAAPEQAKPILVAMASDIGTGFAAMPEEVVRSTSAAPTGWLRLEKRDPETQVAVDGKIVSEGDLIKAEDITKLRIRPSLKLVAAEDDAKPVAETVAMNTSGSAGKVDTSTDSMEVKPIPLPADKAPAKEPLRTVVLMPAAKTAAPAPITINVAVSVNECDTLAAEPLDVQAVADGKLPNDIDVPRALTACKAAANQHPEIARFKYQYARALYAQGDFKDALTELNAASDAGHVRASYLLGRLYQFGAAVERDPAKAIPLFEAGAKRGDPYSQYALGKALVNGTGVKADVARGMALAERAAESGHTYAMNLLGTEYYLGRFVKKDYARALQFFQESAKREDVYGMVNLGVLYRDGAGVEKDLSRATELFEKARAKGHPSAGRLLGFMAVQNGNANTDTLLGWYRESAERGDAWGGYFAAKLLKDNPNLQRDSGEVVRLLALAASQNMKDISPEAKADLGKSSASDVGKEVQLALQRAGQDVGDIDGKLGARTREAATAVLGDDAPRDSRELLMALLRKEWIDSRPRLDMLGS